MTEHNESDDGTTIAYPVVINVDDHGAKGDGITDDTAAIQAAVNALVDHERAER